MPRKREISVYLDEEQYKLVRRAVEALGGIPMSAWAKSVLLPKAREIVGEAPRQDETREIEIAGDVKE